MMSNDVQFAVTDSALWVVEPEWREVVNGGRAKPLREEQRGGEVSENSYEGLAAESSDDYSDDSCDEYSDDSSDELMNIVEKIQAANKKEKKKEVSLREKARQEKRRLAEEKAKKEKERAERFAAAREEGRKAKPKPVKEGLTREAQERFRVRKEVKVQVQAENRGDASRPYSAECGSFKEYILRLQRECEDLKMNEEMKNLEVIVRKYVATERPIDSSKRPIRQSTCNYNSVDSENMVFDDGG